MPSFSTIFLIATTAFAAFSSAAPSANVDSVIAARTDSLEKRCASGCPTLPDIFANVQAKVTVLSDKLNAVVAANAVVEVGAVLPCLDDLKVILHEAVVEVKALSGLSVNVVLVAGVKVLSITEFCQIIVTVLGLICAHLSLVVRCVGSAQAHLVLAVVIEVGKICAELLASVFVCVDGLQVALCPLLGSLVGQITALGLVNVLAVLHVHVAL